MIKEVTFVEKTQKFLTKTDTGDMLTVPKILGGKMMSKFCTNCGAQLEDDVVFCTNCGAKNEEQEAPAEQIEQQEVVTAEEAPAKKNFIEKALEWVKANTLKTMIIAGAAIVVLVLAIILLGGKPYQSAVNNYQAVLNGKASKVEKMAPKEYWEYMEDEYEDFDMDDIVENFEESYETSLEYWEEEYGDNVRIKIKVVDEKKLKDKKVKDLADTLNEKYGIKKKSVKQAYELELEMTIKGSDDEDESERELYAVKIGSKWYLVSQGGSFLY